jgi:hypothetical protein
MTTSKHDAYIRAIAEQAEAAARSYMLARLESLTREEANEKRVARRRLQTAEKQLLKARKAFSGR